MLEKKSIKNNSEELQYWNMKYRVPNAFGEGPTKLAMMTNNAIKSKQIKSILELGCGQGRDSIFFAENNYSVMSVDFSKEAINFVSESAKHQKLSNIKTLVHDLRKDFLFNEKFDLVYSNLALQFFNEENLDGIFRNIHSTLEKNGQFIFSTKKPGDKYHGVGTKISDNAFKFSNITRYFFEKEQIQRLLENKFKVDIFGHERHQNSDRTESVWWYVFCKKE